MTTWELQSAMAMALLVAAASAHGGVSNSISEASWREQLGRLATRASTMQADPCPPHLSEAVSHSGLLSVQLFAEQCGNVTRGGSDGPDDACMAQAAVNASKLCGGAVFFPPTRGYGFIRTVFIDGPGAAIVGAEKAPTPPPPPAPRSVTVRTRRLATSSPMASSSSRCRTWTSSRCS